MDTDRNLQFGLLAMQLNLITTEQFVSACRQWGEHKNVPLGDLLIERGWLLPTGKIHVEYVLAHQQEPDSSATKAFLPSDRRVTKESQVRSDLAPSQRYNLRNIHAVGGMGRVWLARDHQLDRDVALKELRPEAADDAPLKSRFLREARITGQLEHPGIVPVYEVSHHPDSGQPFYTMRFVRGRTLVEAAKALHRRRQTGRAEPLELVSLLSAFVTVCNTIAYAHSHGVIHRDLKGENVILGDFGEVIVLDWGLAKQLGSAEPEPWTAISNLALAADGEGDKTIQGDVIGTPGYMAPEQAAGRVDLINERTDIYGLGAILYEILTGQPPYLGGSTLELVRMAERGEPPLPREIWSEVPPALESACRRAMAKEPAQRFPSAAELGQTIHSWQEVQRRQAEEALARQSEILQLILDSMGEGVVVADETGKLLLVNPTAERIIGPHPVGTSLREAREGYELLLPDKVTPCPLEASPLVRAVRGEAVDDGELFIRGPGATDGVWVSINGRPLRDKSGTLKGGVVVVREITERKRVEEELRRSRERFELAVQGSQDGLWDWDLQTNEVFFSPRWKALIGYEDHEIAHRLEEWETRLHPDERERVLAANYAHADGLTPHYEHEYRLRHKDGTYRWILARGVALRDKQGKAYRMAGSHVDVTARKENEQALKESEDRYQALMACLHVGVLVLDADGKIRDCNAKALSLLGISLADIRGHPCHGLPCRAVRDDGTPFPMDTFPTVVALRTGTACPPTVIGINKPDGGVSWLSVSATPLSRAGESWAYGVVGMMEEVSHRPPSTR